MPELHLTTLPSIPLIHVGDDLVPILLKGLGAAHLALQNGDILVFASKIVSKAEGRVVALETVTPSPRAYELAQVTGKDAREIELILSESATVARARPGLIITRHRLGYVCANAGVDHSNLEATAGGSVLLLPRDPDASAQTLRERLIQATGAQVGIVIADSHGRPHRSGAIGIAIGVAGLPALENLRGRPDLFGYILQHSEMGFGDLVASAATLLLGQADEGTPVVHLRGVPYTPREGTGRELVREKELDLFL